MAVFLAAGCSLQSVIQTITMHATFAKSHNPPEFMPEWKTSPFYISRDFFIVSPPDVPRSCEETNINKLHSYYLVSNYGEKLL